MSSFGSPGTGTYTGKPVPPERGSFPLDHDGECKHVMTRYLSCIKKVKGVNEDECRNLAKSYLACRMDRNLMARDDFKNLGFAEEPSLKSPTSSPGAGGAGS
ncbi:putative cytochrome c oxidase assembly protein cox19 [Rosellinia necatrix]|uniref:Putative cytochrome c oxidase assembly protein cox19 n=1 Tax=Rosellinia necatrix TaxID=77044 RepID=A0A1W2TUT9_ROSNE|nr:putative cytochrome c oxidase assembly protein cox19 [Rosellinia necatrix]